MFTSHIGFAQICKVHVIPVTPAYVTLSYIAGDKINVIFA